MKYRVNVANANGYRCGCCRRVTKRTVVCDSYAEALALAVLYQTKDSADGYYESAEGVAEGPEDFAKDEYGDWELRFSPFEFDTEVRLVAARTEQLRQAEEKAAEEAEEARAKAALERHQLYLELKKEFEP